jgi:hypothetical protein
MLDCVHSVKVSVGLKDLEMLNLIPESAHHLGELLIELFPTWAEVIDEQHQKSGLTQVHLARVFGERSVQGVDLH